jgi:hypothetical protein
MKIRSIWPLQIRAEKRTKARSRLQRHLSCYIQREARGEGRSRSRARTQGRPARGPTVEAGKSTRGAYGGGGAFACSLCYLACGGVVLAALWAL